MSKVISCTNGGRVRPAVSVALCRLCWWPSPGQLEPDARPQGVGGGACARALAVLAPPPPFFFFTLYNLQQYPPLSFV
jgi:hypothetical protein